MGRDTSMGAAGVRRRLVLVSCLLAVLAGVPAAWAQAPAKPPVREITRIAGEVYRFRNNFHYSIFAVTRDGIIATDPINADAATWLKAEFAKRFGKPVRYLIYSHDHRDHIAGGQVFADTAVVIAHENAKPVILGEKRPTAVPQVTFRDRMTIELGGTVVELLYMGRNHSDNMIVLRFPAERILYAVDFIPVDTVAFRDLPDAWMPDWIESLKRVEALDFDILAPGHGPMGRKANVHQFREYLESLHDQVLAQARAGKPLAEIKQAVNLEKWSGWAQYKEFRDLNVEGMYRMVMANRRDN